MWLDRSQAEGVPEGSRLVREGPRTTEEKDAFLPEGRWGWVGDNAWHIPVPSTSELVSERDNRAGSSKGTVSRV